MDRRPNLFRFWGHRDRWRRPVWRHGQAYISLPQVATAVYVALHTPTRMDTSISPWREKLQAMIPDCPESFATRLAWIVSNLWQFRFLQKYPPVWFWFWFCMLVTTSKDMSHCQPWIRTIWLRKTSNSEYHFVTASHLLGAAFDREGTTNGKYESIQRPPRRG